MNVCALVGRIASDPEMRYTPDGTPVVTFRLAVDRGRKDESGERQTDFLDIVAFRRTAEFVMQYLDKGAMIGVDGRIQARQWQTSDGQTRRSVEIVANNVHFVESRQEAERRRAAKGAAAPGAPPPTARPSVPRPTEPPPADDYPPVADYDNEDPFADT